MGELLDRIHLKTSSFNGTTVEQITNPNTLQKEYLTALPTDYTGWTYYAVQDEEDILSPLNALTRVLFIFVICSTVVPLKEVPVLDLEIEG